MASIEGSMKRREFLRLAGVAAATVAVGATAAGCAKKTEGSTGKLAQAQDVNFTKEVDVLVMGCGGAGMSGAYAPAKAGLKTLIVDKLTTYGGAGRLAAGLMPFGTTADAIKNRGQKGDVDTAWTTMETYHKSAVTTATASIDQQLDLKKGIFYGTYEIHGVLTDEFKVKWMPMVADSANYYQGWYVPGTGMGQMKEMYKPMAEGLQKLGAEMMFDTSATDFIVDADNKVVGMRCQNVDGTITDIKTKAILLAGGGFISNQQMVVEYLPKWSSIPCAQNDNDGSTFTLGLSVGGALDRIDTYTYLLPSDATLACVAYYQPMMSILPNGKRFVKDTDEHAMGLNAWNAGFSEFWNIWDAQAANSVWKSTFDSITGSKAITANSIAELAAKLGIHEATLAASFAERDVMAATKTDPKFKQTRMLSSLKPPYFAWKQKVQRYKTQGGLKLDNNCQLLDANGGKIANVWAAGQVNINCGNDLSPTMGMGMYAGKNIVKALKG